MRLRELVGAIAPLRVTGDAETEVAGLRHDSRAVRPGDLFFALPGAATNGNRFIKAACERGTRVIVSELEAPPPPAVLPAAWVQVDDAVEAMGRLADRFFGHPSGALTVIGVTGTNGKTTTTYFLEAIVAASGGKPGVVGTVDYRLEGKVLSKAPNTTPVSLELQRLLAAFRDGGATHACMEVSSHALALKRVEQVDFDAAVFTNLASDHLDFHKTADEYLAAKMRLFELLNKASTSKRRRVAAINADDERRAAVQRAAAGAEIVLFGLSDEATFRATDLEPTLTGTNFTIQWKGKKHKAGINLVGEHNVYNAMAAAAAAAGLGVDFQGIVNGLGELTHVPGRLEPVDEGQPFTVLVDFAHTAAALETVLKYLRRLPCERIVSIFGCGGDRDRTKRGPMGLAACRYSDLAIVTSDNPRGEDPLAIIGDVEDALKTAGLKNYKIQPDREAAIEEALGAARPGDIVLIAGKGHEAYQLVKGRELPFDDRVVAAAALRKLAKRT